MTEELKSRYIDTGLLTNLLEKVNATLNQVDANLAQANQTVEQLKTQKSALSGQRSLLTDLTKAAKEI